MRRLLKWLAGILGVLLVLVIVLVVVVLGVNPLESEADDLWDLVSHNVNFYVRTPGFDLVESDFVNARGDESFPELLDQRDDLKAQARRFGEEINPQIPFGLVKVQPIRDFLGKEVAFGGRIRLLSGELRFERFVIVTRVPFYGRFLSALRRGFVRDKVEGGDRIEVLKGSYFKAKMDERLVEQLAPFRIPGKDNDVLYFTRIRDCVVVSDSDQWIEDALRKSGTTLRADPDFETAFMRSSEGGPWVETYIQRSLASAYLGKLVQGSDLMHLQKRILPTRAMGEMTVRLKPESPDLLRLEWTNQIPANAEFDAGVRKFYAAEKTDLTTALGVRTGAEDAGIGRFVPAERTLAAAVVQLPGETLLEMARDALDKDYRALLEDSVREKTRSSESLDTLIGNIGKGLGKSHLMILHRHPAFDAVDYSRYETGKRIPKRQLSTTMLMRLKDTANPDQFLKDFRRYLTYLSVKNIRLDSSKRFYTGVPEVQDEELELIEPAFGLLPGKKYVFFSTSLPAARAVLEAAERPEKRLASDPELQKLFAGLPSRGSLGVIVQPEILRKFLMDDVRRVARIEMNVPQFAGEIRQQLERQGVREPELSRRIREEKANYKEAEYIKIKDRYEASLEWLATARYFVLTANFGEQTGSATALFSFIAAAGGDKTGQ